MRTKEELADLAVEISEGKIFGDWLLKTKEDKISSFPLLGLMDKEQIEKMIEMKTVAVYGYFSEAVPMSVNNMPIFFSMYCISEGEMNILRPMIESLNKSKEIAKKKLVETIP